MNLHKILMIRVYQRLSALGNNVLFNVRLKGGGTIDVFGFKKHKARYYKTGVIVVSENTQNIEKKLSSYKPYFDKIIIVTSNKNEEFADMPNVWRFPITTVTDKEMLIYEYSCVNCGKVCYGSENIINCPYCNKSKCLEVTFSCNRFEHKVISLPEKYKYHTKSINKIRVLRNPGFIEKIDI